MFQPSAKRCFTIESLVAKDTPLSPEEPLRPSALNYPPPAASDAFPGGFQGAAAAGRALYGGTELVFPRSRGAPGSTRRSASARSIASPAPSLLLRTAASRPAQLLPLGAAEPLLRAPLPRERSVPGEPPPARPLRPQTQTYPHRLLPIPAAAVGKGLREEPLRGGRRTQAAGQQPQPLRDPGESVVPKPADEIQTAEAGGGRSGLGAEEERFPSHQPMAPRHQAVERRRHRRHLQRLRQGQAPGAAAMQRNPGDDAGTRAASPHEL